MIVPQTYTTDKLLVIRPPLVQSCPCCKTRLGCANALHTEEGPVVDKKKGLGNDVEASIPLQNWTDPVLRNAMGA